MTCLDCGTVDPQGTPSPSRLVHHGTHYSRAWDWLCRACSPVVWRRYLATKAHRLTCIEYARVYGYAPTRAQLLAHQTSEQLSLFRGGA